MYLLEGPLKDTPSLQFWKKDILGGSILPASQKIRTQDGRVGSAHATSVLSNLSLVTILY